MTYLEKIQNDLKTSMKDRDSDRTRTLRTLISKLKEKRIELIRDLSEDEELKVLSKAAKERRESAETYRNAGRPELADAEEKEGGIIEAYLPAQISDAEIEAAVRRIIAETGAEGPRDMGKVMGPAMQALSGRADGKTVQNFVRKLLG